MLMHSLKITNTIFPRDTFFNFFCIELNLYLGCTGWSSSPSSTPARATSSSPSPSSPSSSRPRTRTKRGTHAISENRVHNCICRAYMPRLIICSDYFKTEVHTTDFVVDSGVTLEVGVPLIYHFVCESTNGA